MAQKIQFITALGIETSCDDTGVSVVSYCKKTGKTTLLSNAMSSQIDIHRPYGGVVPQLAAREHVKNILPMLRKALRDASVTPNEIDIIAVTNAPGLIPALLAGTSAARTLSWFWKKPLLGIHHLEGHIYASFLEDSQNSTSLTQSSFPLLALIVSGGHTQLVLMREQFRYEIIGETQDDAAGEAFDKTARILGLSYPGGPEIAKRALQYSTALEQKQTHQKSKSSQSDVFPSLPRPMLHSRDFNFSFSGLKTAVLYATQSFRKKNSLKNSDPLPEIFVNAMCAEFEQAVADVLVQKTIKAAKKYSVKKVILTGGVSANQKLRSELGNALSTLRPSIIYHPSPINFSTDNAAMIAAAGAARWARLPDNKKQEAKHSWKTLKTVPSLSLSEISFF